MSSSPKYLLAFLIVGLVFFGWSPPKADAQSRPLTYPVIITALNSKVPNRTYRNRGEVIAYLIRIIKERKVSEPLTDDIEKLLRDSGATDLLIRTIRENAPDTVDEELQRLVGQITSQLDNAENILAENGGLRKTHDYSIDFLEKNTKDSLTITLYRGMGYILVGVCDEDCTDIDIRVLDPRGNLVASDFTVGDVPRVVVEPTSTGEYTVEIIMEECSKEPCLYGLGVFGK